MLKKINIFSLKYFFIIVLSAQIITNIFYLKTTKHKDFITEPLSPFLTEIFSLGDKQFLFRFLVLKAQNFGDNWGNFTPLSELDYNKIYAHLNMLDTLDDKSNLAPFIAAYIYGITQVSDDSIKIIDYLKKHSLKNPETKWRWLVHALYLARHRIKDDSLTLDIAYILAGLNVSEIPIWTKQFPAFILADIGRNDEALLILNSILQSDTNLSKEEYNFMKHYINDFMK